MQSETDIYHYTTPPQMAKYKNITPTIYRQELKGKILVTAMSLFKREGIKRVKMDDIAQALSISKRTLYETYENKEQLLCEGVIYEHQLRQEQLRQFTEQAENEIEVVMEFIRQEIVLLGGVNPLFFSELAKYERVVELLNEEHEQKRLHSMEFVKRGVEKGYFRSDINYDIVTKMSDAVVQHVMMTRMYEEYPLSEIFRNHVDILFRGIFHTLHCPELLDQGIQLTCIFNIHHEVTAEQSVMTVDIDASHHDLLFFRDDAGNVVYNTDIIITDDA